MSTTFAQLGVPKPICDALARNGIQAPFAIQAATISDSLAGRDVCGRAPTGSGKTLAFGIPLVINTDRAKPKRPRSLVLAPTRELADQIADELRTFAGDVRITVVYGGVGYGKQESQLKRGTDIVVACPGRLEDLLERRSLELTDVDSVVVDEADRLADMGFLPAVRRILNKTSHKRQTVLFSATLDGDVAKLTRDYQNNPVTHEVGDTTPDITAAEHRFWKVERPDRIDATAHVINDSGQAIVFCRTRHGSDRLARQLTQRGVSAAAIHGGHQQNRRTRTLGQFTEGRIQALIATDVAARGIHVDDVAAVVHYDPPADHKTYIHRSGRTARAGRGGLVVSMILPEQVADTKKMKAKVGIDAPITVPGEIAESTSTHEHTNSAAAQSDQEQARSSRKPNGGNAGRSNSNGNRPTAKTSSHRRGKPGAKKRPNRAGGKSGSPNGNRGNSRGGAGSGQARSRSRSGGRGSNR